MSGKLQSVKRNSKKQIKKIMDDSTSRHLGMFDLIPNNCSHCQTPFDKKSKQHAQTWMVSADYEKKEVVLFCPTCVEELKIEKTKVK